MTNTSGLVLNYALVPALIAIYAQTGIPAYMYALAILVTIFFLLIACAGAVLKLNRRQVPRGDQLALREKIRKHTHIAILHLALCIMIALAIFVYVNSYIGVVYAASLFLLYFMRRKLLRG